jgi:hypothetical protein
MKRSTPSIPWLGVAARVTILSSVSIVAADAGEDGSPIETRHDQGRKLSSADDFRETSTHGTRESSPVTSAPAIDGPATLPSNSAMADSHSSLMVAGLGRFAACKGVDRDPLGAAPARGALTCKLHGEREGRAGMCSQGT